MSKAKISQYTIYSIIVSFIGLVLSFFLIKEFFGTAGDFISSLCTVTTVENGCEQVAKSDYSGFRNLPFFGDIPIALFGFVFYGFVLILSFFSYRKIDDEPYFLGTQFLIRDLLMIALFVDLILFSISLFVIKAICPLCVSTYIVTAVLLYLTFTILKTKKEEDMKLEFGFFKKSIQNIQSNAFNYILIVLFFAACGLGGGKYSQSSTESLGNINDSSIIEKKIKIYESNPILNLDTTGAPMIGDPKAPITIVKYADFNCGHCMHTGLILSQMLAEYSGLIKVYYKNFPLDGNCNQLIQRKSPDASSCIAASASICADKQKKFSVVYKDIYKDNEAGVRHSAGTILAIAKKANLDLNAFSACLNSKEVSDQINREVEEAGKLNIQSTPSLYVNNKALESGTPDVNFLRALFKHLSSKL